MDPAILRSTSAALKTLWNAHVANALINLDCVFRHDSSTGQYGTDVSANEATDRTPRSPRPSVSPLLMASFLYWIGFRRRGIGTTESASRASPINAGEPVADAPAHFAAVQGRPRSWADVVSHVWSNIGRHRVMAIAAGVTFYSLLAIFPAIATIVTLYGLFSDPATLRDQLNNLSGAVPGGALNVIGDQVSRISQHGHSSLGLALIVSLLVSLWSANSGMKAVFDALNVVPGTRHRASSFGGTHGPCRPSREMI